MSILADEILDLLDPDVIFTFDDHTAPLYYQKAGANLPTVTISPSPTPIHGISAPRHNTTAPAQSQGNITVSSLVSQTAYFLYSHEDYPDCLRVHKDNSISNPNRTSIIVIRNNAKPEITGKLYALLDPNYTQLRPQIASLCERLDPIFLTASRRETSFYPTTLRWVRYHNESGILLLDQNNPNTYPVQMQVVSYPATYPKSYTYSFDNGTSKTLTLDSATTATVDGTAVQITDDKFEISHPSTNWYRFEITDPLDFVTRVKEEGSNYDNPFPDNGIIPTGINYIGTGGTNYANVIYAGSSFASQYYVGWSSAYSDFNNPFTLVLDYTSNSKIPSSSTAYPWGSSIFYCNGGVGIKVQALSDDKVRIHRNGDWSNTIDVVVPSDTQVLVLRRNADNSLSIFSDGVLTDTVADFSLNINGGVNSVSVNYPENNIAANGVTITRSVAKFDRALTDTEIAQISNPTQNIKEVTGTFEGATSGDVYLVHYGTGQVAGTSPVDANGKFKIDNFDFSGDFLLIGRTDAGKATTMLQLEGSAPYAGTLIPDGSTGTRTLTGESIWKDQRHGATRFIYRDDTMQPLVKHTSSPEPYTIKLDYTGTLFMVEVFDKSAYWKVI